MNETNYSISLSSTLIQQQFSQHSNSTAVPVHRNIFSQHLVILTSVMKYC